MDPPQMAECSGWFNVSLSGSVNQTSLFEFAGMSAACKYSAVSGLDLQLCSPLFFKLFLLRSVKTLLIKEKS